MIPGSPRSSIPKQGSKYKWGIWKAIPENIGKKPGEGGREARQLMKMSYSVGQYFGHLAPNPAGTFQEPDGTNCLRVLQLKGIEMLLYIHLCWLGRGAGSNLQYSDTWGAAK